MLKNSYFVNADQRIRRIFENVHHNSLIIHEILKQVSLLLPFMFNKQFLFSSSLISFENPLNNPKTELWNPSLVN
jgi:hypothetical protein